MKLSPLIFDEKEKEIKKWKTFYFKYFSSKSSIIDKTKRNSILSELKHLYKDYKSSLEEKSGYSLISEVSNLEDKLFKFLTKHFGESILKEFEKHPEKHPTRIARNEGFLPKVLDAYLEIIDDKKSLVNHHLKVLRIIFNIYKNYGIHRNISLRNFKDFGYYNVIIDFISYGNLKTEMMYHVEAKYLSETILNAWENRVNLVINGCIIRHERVQKIMVTQTVFQEDEIPLLAEKENFYWNEKTKDIKRYIKSCTDVTTKMVKNPYLIPHKSIRVKHVSPYISLSRIEELKKIENDQFDLNKLIQLCEELNNASRTGSTYSISTLSRSIIDHVPPIFSCESFKEYVNNIAPQSIKKSLLHLQNSLRNISDNHLHSQAQKKEIIPTEQQVNYSNDLDVLLGEIIRKTES